MISNSATILVDQNTKKTRTDILARLYGMDFNLIPVNGKHPPCIEWKPYQTQRVSPEEIKEWMRGRFPSKDGKTFWKAENLNFALLTGSTPWSQTNPGTVVIDTDDEEAEELVKRHCPEIPDEANHRQAAACIGSTAGQTPNSTFPTAKRRGWTGSNTTSISGPMAATSCAPARSTPHRQVCIEEESRRGRSNC